MPSPPLSSLLLLLLPLLLTTSAATTPDDDVPYNTTLAETVHDKLAEYGLPKGLLPSSASSFSLSPSTGLFRVTLTGSSPCYVHFSRLVYYAAEISGRISHGRISDLQGVQAKKLFLWVSVTGIQSHPDRGTVGFEVGVLSEELSTTEFEMIPRCGNGLQRDAEVEDDAGEFPCREAVQFFPRRHVEDW